jgi:magnesium transporter
MSVPEVPVNWVDLLDPTPEELAAAWTGPLDASTKEALCATADFDDLPRPRFATFGGAVVGVLLLPVLVTADDRLYHQEIDLVLTSDAILTVRKTPRNRDGEPSGDPPYDIDEIRASIRSEADGLPGHIALFVVDDVAEAFLDLVDDLLDLIDDLEDRVDTTDSRVIQRSISKFRHDLLHLRRIVAPSRDAVRRVVDGRIELDDGTLFPRQLELAFGDVYDKFLRASDSMESARELIGGVRDYLQAKISNDQNEVMKRLTVSASLLLVPTFIVGLYGQNFVDIPELRWRWGYAFSWALIVITTVGQLVWFRRKRCI